MVNGSGSEQNLMGLQMFFFQNLLLCSWFSPSKFSSTQHLSVSIPSVRLKQYFAKPCKVFYIHKVFAQGEHFYPIWRK